MRPNRMLLAIAVLLSILPTSICTMARAAASDPEEVLYAWLELVNAGAEADVIETFIREHFAARLIDAFPMDEHVSMFSEIHREDGHLEFHSFRASSSDRVQALLHNERGQWLLLTLYFDPETGLIHGLGLDDGADPPDVLDAPRAADLDAWGKAIREYAEARAGRDIFSGTMLIQLDGKEVIRGAWGEASRRYGVPNRIDTKFNLGSMNKMFTAVAIAQLVERDKLDWQDTVGTHLPDFPNSDIREKVTIHHLLSHTSGMGSHFTDEFIEGAKDRFRHFTTYVPLFAEQPLAFEPGERFSYSNAGFFVLGMIVEAASGESYYDYVRRHIYEPAGMMNTDCYDVDLPVPNLATGYTQQQFDEPEMEDHAPWMEEIGPWRENTLMHSVKGGPAGGGYSTVEDLGRFAKALTDGTLISADTLEIMTAPKSDVQERSDGSTGSYGYGFGVTTLADGTRLFGHSGGFPGINAVLHIYPGRDGFTAVMANVDGGASPIASFAERVMPEK